MKKRMFKQICILFLTLTIFVANVQPAFAFSDKYKKLSGEQKYTEIKEQIIQSTHDLAEYKAADAYRDIVSAISEFNKLRDLVNRASHVDDVIDEVADRLDNIASTYERVSNLSGSLAKFRNGEFRHLKDMNGETFRTERELEREISRLQYENTRIRDRLPNTLDDIEKNNLEVSLKGNLSVINSLRAQIAIWNKFYEAQNRLSEKLDINARKVDSLFHILEVNSRVYREAANTTRLRKTAKGALDSLSSLGDLQNIVDDVQSSWTELDSLVNDISNAEFSINLD